MKKALIALTLIMVAILLFTGCSAAVSTSTTSATSSQPSPTPSIKPPQAASTSTETSTAAPTTAPTTTTETIKKGGTLKYLYPFSPTSIPGWPGDDTNMQKLWANWTVFEPLVKLDSNGNPIPWLATSWKWGPNNTYIDFTLRQGVKFTDGTVFNADAVKMDYDELLTEKNSATVNWDHPEKIDDYTFRLYLKVYNVDFWGSVTNFDAFIVSPTVLAQGIDYTKANPVGTGPFMFKSFQKDVSLIFVKNPDYWQPGKPYLDEIDMITVTETLTMEAKLEAGEGDISCLQFGKILQDMQQKGFNIQAQYAGTEFMIFDTKNTNSVTNDPNVRMAIEYALDKKSMSDGTGYGYNEVNNQLMPPGNPGFDSNLASRDYSVDKAKQLLAASGFTTGLKVHLIAMNGDESVVTYLQQYLQDAGITLDVEMVDNAKFWNYSMQGWNGILLVNYTTGVYLPSFVRGYFPPIGVYDVSCTLPQDLLDKANAAVQLNDSTAFKTASDAIAQEIYDQCLFVPLFSSAGGDILSSKVMDSGIMKYIDWSVWDPADCWLNQ